MTGWMGQPQPDPSSQAAADAFRASGGPISPDDLQRQAAQLSHLGSDPTSLERIGVYEAATHENRYIQWHAERAQTAAAASQPWRPAAPAPAIVNGPGQSQPATANTQANELTRQLHEHVEYLDAKNRDLNRQLRRAQATSWGIGLLLLLLAAAITILYLQGYISVVGY